jgi:hypothetical protein
MEDIRSTIKREEQNAQRSQFPEQDENGIDLSLIRENLRLTPTERMEKHQRALDLVWEVRRAGQKAGLFRNR